MAEMQRSDWLTSMKSTHRRFGPSSLSCKDVVVNGEDRKIMIINSDDFDLKYAHCIFDDSLIVGSYIEWNDETQIVTKEGGQKDVYPSYELQKCNYELKWVKDGETITKKAYASDMTYSQVGVQHTDYMVYGDSRYRVIIPKDDDTTKIRRGDRFYIDDGDSEDDHPIYEATKIDRITRMYNGNGVYTLMLVECNEHPTDNSDSMVADNNNKTELEEGEWV